MVVLAPLPHGIDARKFPSRVQPERTKHIFRACFFDVVVSPVLLHIVGHHYTYLYATFCAKFHCGEAVKQAKEAKVPDSAERPGEA